MADRTQLKIADKNDFADEDPFAELTRIMGFDPRQPVVRQDVGGPAGRAEPAMDDFGIDLEKELLGDLASEDLTAVPEHAVSYAEPASQASYMSVDAPVAYAPAETSVSYARSQEPSFDAGAFDDAVADSFEQGLALENELIAEPVYEAAPEASYVQQPTVSSDADQAFDDALDASFEQHFSLENELLPVDETVGQAASHVAYEAEAPVAFEAPQAPVVYEAAMAYEAAPVHDLDADFDVALADVDMDFAAHDDAAEATYAEPEMAADDQLTLGDYQPSEPEAAFAHHEPVEAAAFAPVAHAQDYDEFEHSLQNALSDDEPAFEAEPVLTYVPAAAYEPEAAPVAAAPVAAAEDNSLEDELNALLGVMSSQAKALSEPVAAPAPVVEPVAAQPATSYASWVAPQPRETPYQPYVPAQSYAPAREVAPAPVEATYAAPSYDHQADDDVSFDDDAFDMAFERSAADEPAAVAAAPVQPAADRPLAASRYEQARSWGLTTPLAPRAATAEIQPIQKPDAYVSAAPTYEPVAPAYEPAAATYEPVAETYVSHAEPVVELSEPEPVVDIADDLEAELFAAVSSYDDAPDIETVDVPEKAVALADDLDIPELSFEDDTPPAPVFDDLDGEFSNLMNEMNAGDTASQATPTNYQANPYATGFDRKTLRDGDVASHPIDMPAAAAVAGAAAGAAAMYAGRGAQGSDRNAGFDFGSPQQPRHQAQGDEFAYDPDFDETMEASDLAGMPAEKRPARRGMMIAAAVGAVAILGGIGAWALSFGGVEGAGAPVLVKADESPIKVKPENPGGAVVPNQDSKVYDRVAGDRNGAPEQQKLVTNSEEPIDVTAQDAETASNMPLDAEDAADAPVTAKSEERVQPADQPDANTETAAVAPRKVRTMVVKPDGTLVAREEPAAAPVVAATEPADPAPQRVAEPSAEATGTVPAAAKPALAPVAAAKPVQSANTPASAPIAPQRPSEQPVNVVGEVKPDQVAALAPAATTAAASGAWAMQIASQPSEDAAKSTYADLVKRYGSVLNGHQASIVKAEIAGKGTFWRVRVPAGSRNDAVALCESYKAAGGNCFVSK